MALDATIGGPAADSYATTAQADVYADNVGASSWDALAQAEKEAALRRATSWLDATYGQLFGGVRANGGGQSLEWPRVGAQHRAGHVIASDVIPVEVLSACSQAAILEGQAPGQLAASAASAGTQEDRIKIGPIEVELSDSDRNAAFQKFRGPPSVELLLAGLISAAGSAGSAGITKIGHTS